MVAEMEQQRRLASLPYLAAALVGILLLGSACTSGALPSPTPAAPTVDIPRPPLAPRWVYEPWVWEDEEHTAAAVLNLVDDYRKHGVPVGAVIIDSPWQTNYNTFDFGPNYPDPAGLIHNLHGRGVKVLLWATPFINVASEDGPERGKAASYDEAAAADYLVDGGRTYVWEKGTGSVVDFFNPDAVAWWYRQLDRAMRLGVDGWKVDSPERSLPEGLQTAAGPRTRREYGDAYYRAFYRYVAERDPEATITARPIAAGTVYAPLDANPVGWVGDQEPNWQGLRSALSSMLQSAEQGYAVLGSDIGGYRPGQRAPNLFLRWTELGALSPLMENGGRGEHRPWQLGPEVLSAYRYYAKLHHELVPYLYSAGVEASATGLPIIGDIDRQAHQAIRYSLGPDLLVAPMVTPDEGRDVNLPADATWYDYWDDDQVIEGPAVLSYQLPLERIPLFIRGGAIIPMQVDDGETGHGGRGSAGHLTLLVYPDGSSARTYRPDARRSVALAATRDGHNVTVQVGPQTERYSIRIKEPGKPTGPMLTRGDVATGLPSFASWPDFDLAAEGWYYDAARHYLWVRFATRDSAARLTYATLP